MTVHRTEIERALDEIISNEEGMRFQGLAVVLAKQKWSDLVACERKWDRGLDARTPASLAAQGVGKGLACSITATLEKIRDDAANSKAHFDDVSVLIFATPQRVTNHTAGAWAEEIKKDFGYELVIMTREDLITSLMEPSNESICRSFLGIPSGNGDRPAPVWNVPFGRNPFFTGRTEILDSLRDALRGTSTAVLTQAISGLGGIGKTQSAIEYAYRYREEYEHIFWVVADTEATLSSGFVEIAQILDLPEVANLDLNRIIEAVKRWFVTHDGWLLILDNADSPSMVKNFLPASSRGHVLLTSRARVFDMLGIPSALDLDQMSPGEALEFLFRRTAREEINPEERVAAAVLAEELGFLPLALEQAGAYIANKQVLFDDYLVSFRRRRLELLEESPPVTGEYSSSVSTTWDLNFQNVEQISPAAADILRVSAFLSPDNVPLELITDGASELGPSISEALANLQDDPVVVNTLLEPLTKHSLIRRNIGSKTFTVHRLVQAVVNAGMDAENRRTWAQRAVRALNKVFPSASYDTWPACDRLLSHAVHAAKEVKDFHFSCEDAGELLNGVACYLRMLGEFKESERLHLQSVEIRERDLGPEHPEVATCLNNMALVYFDNYEYAKAEPLLVRALAIAEKALGSDNSELALNFNNLGMFYVRWGRYAEAQPLLERALELEKGAAEPTDFFYATILNNLAELHLGLGNNAAAEDLCIEGLEMREQIGNPEKTGRSYITMATILHRKGDCANSDTFFRKAVENRESVYGSEHPELLHTLKRYVELLQSTGRDEDAGLIQSRIDAIRTKHSIRDV